MNLFLVDTEPAICKAWQESFAGAEKVRIFHGDFRTRLGDFDCLVSPANSFGLMDGGIDAAIVDFFGAQLEDKVHREIWCHYRGEQPVGTCLMVPTDDPRCAWLAHCPTMRVPRDVAWTNNAYSALLAALTTAQAHGVQSLACSGLATRTGLMPAEVAANQMRFAFDTWSGTFERPTWESPREREWRSYGRPRAEFLKRSVLKTTAS